jgi:hypothetical protein
MEYLCRTLLKELIMEWTRRDLDKNSFESKDHNLNLIIQSLQVKGFAKKKLQNSDSFCVCHCPVK